MFTDDRMVYAENSKESTKKLLKLISYYSKVAGYKNKIWKSITFLHTSNEQVECEIKNTLPFILTPPHKNEMSRYKSNKICTMMREIKEELNKMERYKWRDSILSRCQFFSTWSIESTQSQSKSQQVILWISTSWF